MKHKKLDDLLKNVAVVGAAGKMGSGIALLLLLEQAKMVAKGAKHLRLVLVDPNEEALDSLKVYLRKQAKKFAEKQINTLRNWYSGVASLVSNEQMIDRFVESAMELIHRSTSYKATDHSSLIFEAAPETIELKKRILSELRETNDKEALFFTNTSSIPIQQLEEQTGLLGRVIGFHFYNPPAIQKLLEIIPTKSTSSEFLELSKTLAERLKKRIVLSKDIAGFIGNGHFLREVSVACQEVKKLTEELTLPEALFVVNQVTESFLIRPMGIFQLIDYVGIDVVCAIALTMNQFDDANLDVSLLKEFLEKGIRGGQNSDGSQKEGIFSYNKMVPVAITEGRMGEYQLLNEAPWMEKIQIFLGPLPEGHLPWKLMGKKEEKEQAIENYFNYLQREKSNGALLALFFLEKSASIIDTLVERGIAADKEAVKTVLTNGFYHLYSPTTVVVNEVST